MVMIAESSSIGNEDCQRYEYWTANEISDEGEDSHDDRIRGGGGIGGASYGRSENKGNQNAGADV